MICKLTVTVSASGTNPKTRRENICMRRRKTNDVAENKDERVGEQGNRDVVEDAEGKLTRRKKYMRSKKNNDEAESEDK